MPKLCTAHVLLTITALTTLYVGCSSSSSTAPPLASPAPAASPPQSAATTVPLAAVGTQQPIPAAGGFSGSFQVPSNNATPGTKVTLTSYAAAPNGAPAPQVVTRIPLRYRAEAHRLSTNPIAIFWVSQQYSSSFTFGTFPSTTWKVPATDAAGPLVVETIDGANNALMDAEFDTSIVGDTIGFFGTPSSFAPIAGHTYWWELVSGKNPPPINITSGSPPGGVVGTPYGTAHAVCTCFCKHPGCRHTTWAFDLIASGGGSPNSSFTWSWTADVGSSVPPGLSVNGTQIVGTPTTTGTYHVILTVADGVVPPDTQSAHYVITIATPSPSPIPSPSP